MKEAATIVSVGTALKRTRVVLALVLVAFLGSLGANAYFLRMVKDQYTRECDVRLDPAGLRVYAKERAETPPATDRPILAFFGDSRALMWGKPALEGYDVRNVGIGYQTTAQLLLRFDADLAPLKPAVVVLEAGVNDLKSIAVLPDRRAEIVDECRKNLGTLVEKSHALGAKVVLVSVIGIGDVPFYRSPLWSNEIDKAVSEVNAHLKTLERDGVVFLDADPLLDDPRGKVKKELQVDYLHVNPKAYELLSEKLGTMVRR